MGERVVVDISTQALLILHHLVLQLSARVLTDFAGEDLCVVQQRLRPRHQAVHIVRRTQPRRLLVPGISRVQPVVLVSWASTHRGARGRCTELGDGPIEHIKVVEEVDCVHCEPLVEVFTLWEQDGCSEVARAEGGLGVSFELVLLCTFGDVALRLEGAGLGETKEGRHAVCEWFGR